MSETLADEWDAYLREVLVPRGVTPELADGLKAVFYGGACAVLALAGSGRSSPSALCREVCAYTSELRGPLQ